MLNIDITLCFIWFYRYLSISLQQKTNKKQINTNDYEVL